MYWLMALWEKCWGNIVFLKVYLKKFWKILTACDGMHIIKFRKYTWRYKALDKACNDHMRSSFFATRLDLFFVFQTFNYKFWLENSLRMELSPCCRSIIWCKICKILSFSVNELKCSQFGKKVSDSSENVRIRLASFM